MSCTLKITSVKHACESVSDFFEKAKDNADTSNNRLQGKGTTKYNYLLSEGVGQAANVHILRNTPGREHTTKSERNVLSDTLRWSHWRQGSKNESFKTHDRRSTSKCCPHTQ